MKILFLTTDFNTGGAGIAAGRLADALQESGNQVLVESLRFSSKGRFSKKKRRMLGKLNRIFEYKFLKFLGFSVTNYISSPWLPFNTIQGINFKSVDVVHIHWINYGLLDLRRIRKISEKVPTVWTLHSHWPITSPYQYPDSSTNKFNSKLIKKVRHYLDKKTSQEIEKFNIHWIVPSAHMQIHGLASTVIHNPLPKSIKAFGREERNYFAYIGAGDVFDPRKGLTNLLISWITSYRSDRNRKLLVIGPLYPTGDQALIELSKRFGVEYVGSVSSFEVMQAYLVRAHALIVPSYQETFGQVIPEALSTGTPVIVRDSLGSLNEFRAFSKYIYSTNFEDEGFTDALLWAEEIDVPNNALTQEIQDYFSPDKIAKLTEEIYLEQINKYNSD